MKLRGILLSLFFLSGATALVYQVLWLRLLTLVFGATTSAVGTVLTSFMVGLALGALLFGHLVDRIPRPLRLYALLELGIGIAALLLPHALQSLAVFYPSLYEIAQDRPWVLPTVRVVFSSALLLVPCTLMGGTLPVLVRYAARAPASLGQHFGWLYGMNVLGAMFGSLVTGLYLIGHFGVSVTNFLAVATNALLAVVFFALDYFVASEGAPSSGPENREHPRAFSFAEKLVVGVAILSGCTVLGLEVLWTRALVHALWSTTHTFSIILATVLLALAVGAFLAARWPVPDEPDLGRTLLGRIAWVELAFAGSLVLTMPLLTQLGYLYTTYYGLLGNAGLLAPKFLTAALLLLVPATFAGMLFPISVQVLRRRMPRLGRSLGGLYLLNALASAGGALLFSFGLIPWLGVARSYQAVIAVHLLGAAVFAYCGSRRVVGLALPTVLMVAALFTFRTIDRPNLFGDPMFADPEMGMELLEQRETADASFAVYEQTFSGERQLFINGFLAADNSRLANYMRMMAHLPLLLHPEPQRALVIAFGTGNTAGAASLHPIEELHIVDISEEVYRLAHYFSATNHDVLSDRRTTALVEDGRNYVQATEEVYDVITSEPMPPKFAGMVSFYTREYYSAARDKLSPRGVLCQWLPFHLMSLPDVRMASRTFLEVFPQSSLWVMGSTGLLIGGRGELPVAADTFARAFENPVLKESLERLNFHSPHDILRTHILDSEGLRFLAGSAPVMTDDRPLLEFSGDQYMYRGHAGPTFDAIREIQERRRSLSPSPTGAESGPPPD